MPPQDVLDEFSRYVQNDIPIRLIYIPEIRPVSRDFVLQHFLPLVQQITEKDIEKWISSNVDRDTAIKKLVSRVVRYAILSHRWLKEGEPGFRDIVNRSIVRERSPSPGFEKLMKACRVANNYGFDFVWSDTCCIDKTSSSELDESIRSMFRWYRNSSMCIVYVAQSSSIADLGRDEWFERGWTLQELLAPRKMKFFGANWKPLTNLSNDKDTNSPVLFAISLTTNISIRDLCYFTPKPSAVDQRMTWAAKRKTTRGEDVAYSLMGMFDVGLQIAYGEGAQRAFCRLIEAIMQANGNTSVLNWAGRPATSHVSDALPSSPACYVGCPDYYSERKLEMSMTSRGLRIPLLVIPVEFMELGDKFRLYSTFYKIGDVGAVSLYGSPRAWQGREWALGVFSYMPQHGILGSGMPGLRRDSVAYLLSRLKGPPGTRKIDLKEGSLVEDNLCHFGWKKVATKEFISFTIHDIPERNDGNMMLKLVDSNILETVYL